jgi:hemoglobin
MRLDSRESIQILIDTFYEKVRKDELLAPFFKHVHWQSHLPVMYNFWCSLILGDQSYQGKPFDRHVRLKLNKSHFDQWLKLFFATVDEICEDGSGQEIKDRAANIAAVWSYQLGVK